MTDKKTRNTTQLSDEEIDRQVVAQTDDADAWEPAVRRTLRPTSLFIPAELAARAAFLAKLHRRADVEEWLTHIIRERVELEEAAFADARQEMSTSSAS